MHVSDSTAFHVSDSTVINVSGSTVFHVSDSTVFHVSDITVSDCRRITVPSCLTRRYTVPARGRLMAVRYTALGRSSAVIHVVDLAVFCSINRAINLDAIGC